MTTNKKKKGFYYLDWATRESLGDYWKDYLIARYNREYKTLCQKSLRTVYAATRKSGLRKKFDKIEICWEPKIVIKGIK